MEKFPKKKRTQKNEESLWGMYTTLFDGRLNLIKTI